MGGGWAGSDRAGPDRTGRGRSIGQSIPEDVRRGPPRASASRPFPLPAAEETVGAGILPSRPYLRSVTGQGASVRSPGRASSGLGLCQAGGVVAAGPGGRGSGPLIHMYVWYCVLL